MQTHRWIIAGITVMTVLSVPSIAAADGGAYLDFGGETHYLSGGEGPPASGTGYVAIPESRQGILDHGPFYAFLLPGNSYSRIEEGRPIPGDAIRVATVSIEQIDRTAFELSVSFSVPDISSGYYDVAICNEPCTVAGFREPLSGTISVVETVREGELLTENSRLQTRTWALRRQAQKAERATDELEGLLAGSRDDLLELSVEVNSLERDLAAERTTPATNVPVSEDRPLVNAWALVAIVVAALLALASIALGIVFSRRNAPRIVVPDTIAELDDEAALHPAAR